MCPQVQLLRDEDVRTKSSGHFEGNLRRNRVKGGRGRLRWVTVNQDLGVTVRQSRHFMLNLIIYNLMFNF